jgi:hypothetical protein
MRDYLIDNESTIKDVFERQQKEFQVVNVSEDEE